MAFILKVIKNELQFSGLSTSGYHACPCCGGHLSARHSSNLRKMVFENHFQYLPENHPMCRRTMSRDNHLKRVPHMSPMDWLKVWVDSNVKPPEGMKRLSILYSLPYWRHLLIGHLLDPMHIFKNVGHSLWKHITGAKDTRAARDDLREIGVKKSLWTKTNSTNRKVYFLEIL